MRRFFQPESIGSRLSVAIATLSLALTVPLVGGTAHADAANEEASVVGCLCTPLDRLADKATFPRAEVGDLVAVFCAGAYGASASPAQFLGQGPAAEMLV